MKKTLLTATLTFGAALLLGTAARAQNVSVTAGDLLVSFYAVSGQGVSTNLEVDLGQISQFLPGGADATGAPITLSLLSTTDLSTIYGSSWNSLSTLYWSATAFNGTKTYGGTLARYTLFGTEANNAEIPVGDTNQESEGGPIATFVGGLSSEAQTANSTGASAVPTGDAESFNSASGYGAGGAPPYFAIGEFDSNFVNDTDGTTMSDLYEILDTGAPGTDLGTFTLSSGGLTFQSPQAVPEPSTWATIILGAVALVAFGRRRRRIMA